MINDKFKKMKSVAQRLVELSDTQDLDQISKAEYELRKIIYEIECHAVRLLMDERKAYWPSISKG